MLEAGKTRKEISAEIGVSRSAVAGRIHRLKIALPENHPFTKCSSLKKSSNTFTKRDKTKRVGNRFAGRSTKVAAAPVLVERIEEFKIEKPTSIVSLSELSGQMCRYPLWSFEEKASNFYCGSPVSAPEGRKPKSFCAYHHALCYVPAKLPVKRSLDEAKKTQAFRSNYSPNNRR